MEQILRKLRKSALFLSHKCQDGNIQSVFSCLEIVWTLYDKIMHWTPETAEKEDRDFFIISKGQATLALYPVLIEKGFLGDEGKNLIPTLRKWHSPLQGHPDMKKLAGVGTVFPSR